MFRIQDLSLVLASTGLFLLLLEGGLRIAYPIYASYHTEMWRYAKEIKQISRDPRIVHEHRKNVAGTYSGVEIRTNSEGWRDREYLPQSKGYRIMVLGDSITLGWGVPVEMSFPKVLEKKISAPPSSPVEVINTGVGNYNTENEVYSFLEKGARFAPNLVLVGYYINDAELSHPFTNPFKYALMTTYLYGFTSGYVLNLEMRWDPRLQYRNYYSALYEESFPGRLVMEHSLEVLGEYGRSKNIEICLAIIPEMHQFKDYPFLTAHRIVKEAAQRNGITAIDLLPDFVEKEPSRLWVSNEDAHPNIEGQKMIADGIYERLQKQLPRSLGQITSFVKGPPR